MPNFMKIYIKCNTTPTRESSKILVKFRSTLPENSPQFIRNLSKILRATPCATPPLFNQKFHTIFPNFYVFLSKNTKDFSKTYLKFSRLHHSIQSKTMPNFIKIRRNAASKLHTIFLKYTCIFVLV